MKRSPLNRTSPLKRTPFVRRARRNDRPEVRADWAASRIQRCACCWAPGGLSTATLHRHHLLGGARRIDDPRNLLLLCFQWNEYRPRCHDLFHGANIRREDGSLWPALTLGMMLVLKAESDPDNYDPEYLQSLLGKRLLPEIEPLPQEFITERERWEQYTRRGWDGS